MVELLAPEAIMRNDLKLLKRLFEPFEGVVEKGGVEGWEEGGEVRYAVRASERARPNVIADDSLTVPFRRRLSLLTSFVSLNIDNPSLLPLLRKKLNNNVIINFSSLSTEFNPSQQH